MDPRIESFLFDKVIKYGCLLLDKIQAITQFSISAKSHVFILIQHMFIPHFSYTYDPMTVVSMVHIKQAELNWFN